MALVFVLVAWLIGLPPKQYWLENWGNIAGTIGVFVSVVGFALTAYLAKDAVTAARAAELAATEAKESVYNFDSIVQLTKAIVILDQITQYHRDSAWNRLPPLYAEARACLVALASDMSRLTENQRATVSSVRLQLTGLDDKVELFVGSRREGDPPGRSGWLAVLKTQTDTLILLQAELRVVQGD